ncbi:MAG: metallophosphoesterase family protein [Oligosphaeraceae bacterium]|nr:metallophosphoesterase family protein [Oligosphaeraceae bacterium]
MNKIAFISDIHGNIEALDAILAKIEEVGCDKIYCLGDIVGYGPDPGECINRIQELEIESVMGNHDEYVTLLMDPRVERLRQEVRDAISWTQGNLSMDDLRWLSKRPMRIVTEHFTCLHGSFIPQAWGYCLDEKTFAANFKYQDVSLAFCGHSHSPLVGIDTPGELPYVDFIRRAVLDLIDKTMVNVGSVGQPRDGDPRACAVTYEPATRTLDILRAEYDYEATQAKILEQGLPERFASRLSLGR